MNIPYTKQYDSNGKLIPIDVYPTLAPNRKARRARPARAHGESNNFHLQVVGRRAFHVVRQRITMKRMGTMWMILDKPKTITHYLERK